ncbi:MAG: hypothetical protein ACKPBU_11660 [Alphaproteobacteria bacterium]
MSDSFERRRLALEEEFFKKQNDALLEKLRNQVETERPAAVLGRITGITDAKVLDTLVALHVNHETLAAFALYPLVEVAWADGRVDEGEREAVLKAAAEQGIASGTAVHEVLGHLLADEPTPAVRDAWHAWAKALRGRVEPSEADAISASLVRQARAVAEASGGFLGVGRRVNEREQLVIDGIGKAFVA